MIKRSTSWAQHGIRLKDKAGRTTGRRSGLYAWSAAICFLYALRFQKEEQQALRVGLSEPQGLALG